MVRQMKCFCCGNEIVELPEGDPRRRDEDDEAVCHYAPAFVLEVLAGGPGGLSGCRAAVICWECLNKINPDMWDCDEYWNARNPVVRFDKLPHFDHDNPKREDPLFYSEFVS